MLNEAKDERPALAALCDDTRARPQLRDVTPPILRIYRGRMCRGSPCTCGSRMRCRAAPCPAPTGRSCACRQRSDAPIVLNGFACIYNAPKRKRKDAETASWASQKA